MSNENFDPTTGQAPAGNDPYAAAPGQPVQPVAGGSEHAASAAIGAQAAQAANQPHAGDQPYATGAPGAAGPATAAPAPKKPRGFLQRLGSLIAMIVVAGMVWSAIHYFTDKAKEADTMKIGNCVTVTRGDDGKTVDDVPNKIACDDYSKPSWVVVKKITSGSCSTNYAPLTYSDPKSKDKVQYTYCLEENMKQGNCYKASDDTKGSLVGEVPVDCKDSAAEFKVAQRIDGTADTSKCTADQKARELTDSPQRLYCLAQAA